MSNPLTGFLKKVFPSINLKDAVKLEGVKLLSGNSYKKTKNITVIDKQLVIVVDPENPKSIQQIEKALPGFLEEAPQGSKVINAETQETLKLTGEALNHEDSQLTIAYFRKLLTPDDIAILKTSLVIKRMYETDMPVQNQKQLLSMKYGQRANIITNLCTADYFETYIKPLNESLLEKEEYSVELFREYFDKLIEDFPLAIFVHRGQGVDKLVTEISERIERNKLHGIEELYIHAIGVGNVKKLQNAIDVLIKEKNISGGQVQEFEEQNEKISKIFISLS